MVIRFDDISETAEKISFERQSLALETESTPVLLTGFVSLRRRGEDEVILRGHAEALIEMECSRCTERAGWPFAADFEYRIVAGAEPAAPAEEVESRGEDADLLCLDTPEIDLDEILREQVYLHMPQQILCRPDCRGLCVGCGVDLNSTVCRCPEETLSSPFAVLNKLKQ